MHMYVVKMSNDS